MTKEELIGTEALIRAIVAGSEIVADLEGHVMINTIVCPYCGTQFTEFEAAKTHDGQCGQHPMAVKMAELAAELGTLPHQEHCEMSVFRWHRNAWEDLYPGKQPSCQCNLSALQNLGCATILSAHDAAKEQQIVALSAGLRLAHEQMLLAGMGSDVIEQTCGLDACKRALELHKAALVKPLVDGLERIDGLTRQTAITCAADCANTALEIARAVLAVHRKTEEKL